MKKGQNINKQELSFEEKEFILTISQDNEIPFDILEAYFADLRVKVKKAFKSDDLIGKIDYNGKLSDKESAMLKCISNVVLGIIYDHWDLGNYKKCVVAGLILHHYKLDKYDRIKTAEEFDLNPTDSAPNYNRYLYDRIRSKFKSIKHQKNTFLHN